MQKYKTKLIQLTLWLAFATTFISGQNRQAVEDVISIETDAVFIDALVRDKKTGKPVVDLKREDFTLKVDDKLREISEFSFDGKTNCPLTIILYFNFAPNGALRYLEQPKTQKSLSESLANLDENDEVAVISAHDWFVGKPQFLLKPNQNWELVAKSIADATNEAILDGQKPTKPDRLNQTTMTEAIAEVEKLTAERPGRAMALVYISDGVNTLDTMDFGSRRQLARRLVQNNISFSALNFSLLTGYSVAANVINPLAFAFGASVTGSANYLAKESGGVAVKIEKAEDFGSSLEGVIRVYSSRYSLGFYLDEIDQDEGKLHKIEVKIQPSKKKKLTVNVRRGFFLKRK